ncbi:MAG: protein-disulfide isomerase [Nitrosopumilus sp.]|nr:protein-disulfide isomerase [Nitrosopumilus sp.]MDH3486426.1 protein-disulfide isomerase [Nitrosopumilus sp.]
MGRKERREREQKRDNYATRHSAEKRKNTLIAVGVFAVIAVIVGYAGWIFVNMSENVPGGPENAGALGSEHSHAGLLVSIFGDEFDFSAPAYQIKSSWIHFEGRDGTTIHKHATGVTLGYLFETLSLGLDDQCFVFQDGRSFCTNEDYKLVFYVNGEQLPDIRDLEIQEDDKILIAYGAETPEEIDGLLLKLENRELIK